MKITFVLPGYPWRPVGAYRVVYEYANQLVSMGNKVTIVHRRRRAADQYSTHQSLYRRLRWQAGRVREMLSVPKVRWQNIDARVCMLYVREPAAQAVPDADAVFATAWDTVEHVSQYPASKGAKFHLVQSYDYWSKLDERTDAIWRSSFNKVVISKWLCDKMVELGFNDFRYIPNAIDHSKFRVTKPITERRRSVAMLFSLSECKGSQDGLHALEIAKQKHPDLHAVLFGIPKKPRNLPGWIEYFQNPTAHDLVQNVYNGSSTYLCPSIKEASPLPPAEAMACGCALVTTDCGGTREYAEDEVTALFSSPHEPVPLAQNLLRVLGDEELRLRLAQGGHERIQEFSWERSAAQLESFVYERIASAEMTASKKATSG